MQFDLPDLTQTIVAVSSPVGSGRRAIVRLTGNEVIDFGTRIFGDAFEKYASANCKIAGRENLNFGDWTDVKSLILLMKAPKSYTKEDVLEIHLPASQPLIESFMNFALENGIRLAAPGEFTLRAFVNGRISAYEVESISRIIESRNVNEAKASASRINSAIIRELYEIEDLLIQTVSRLELSIDFEEDEHDEIDFSIVKQALSQCETRLEQILSRTKASVVSNLPVIAIAGPVNVGKSTLFNLLTKSDAAIISAHEKTTRDFIIGEVEFSKIKASIVDTAGFFDDLSSNQIDEASKHKAQEIVQSASVILWCAEDEEGIDVGKSLILTQNIASEHVIYCLTKSEQNDFTNEKQNEKIIPISARTGSNIDVLRNEIEKMLTAEESADAVSISARENSILHQASQQLESLTNAEVSYDNLEMYAEDLKTVLRTIGKMTGTSLEAETLSYLFSDFCIGK